MSDEARATEDFRRAFDKARGAGAYKPDSTFDEQRRVFFQTALEGTDVAAARLLGEIIQ